LAATGNSLANVLVGNSGANVLNGASGNDRLDGAGGKDVLTGGAGRDTFVFSSALHALNNVDVVKDFNVADDTIALDNAMMPGLGAAIGMLSAGHFWQSSTGLAHDSDDRIIYETDTGKLFYDADGNGTGGRVHFATLGPNLQLTNLDFIVI
jgi:Ca2+-binding RTX toxin-like protein